MADISSEVKAITKDLVNLRRDIHSHPELGFKEVRTSKLVAGKLKSFGVSAKPTCGTGVIGLIKGANAGKTLLVRADMDALPVTELNNVPYKSQNKGVMHACGHDGHVAISTMTAKLLNAEKNRIKGNVKFMFQPAEEGPGGAMPMLKAGILRNPKVDAAVALHMWSELPTGKIGVRSGPIFAISDEFILKVIGKGGHGAVPHKSVDPVAIAGQLITALQNIVSRRIEPLAPAVLTIGKIEGGVRFNVIPDSVTLYGTVRAYEGRVRDKIKAEIAKIANGITSAFGASFELEYMYLYPPSVNHPKMCEVVRRVASEVVGKNNVVEQEQVMGGEDMSFVMARVPTCYFVLGSANAAKKCAEPHHSARFNFDEDALPIGVEVMKRVAERFLSS